MAKHKKHFHCHFCGSGCEIFKKGKRHKILVCPRCGILASNPFDIGGAATGAGLGAAVGSVIPGVGTAIGTLGGAVLGGFKRKKSAISEPTTLSSHPTHRLSSFQKAIALEALEGG